MLVALAIIIILILCAFFAFFSRVEPTAAEAKTPMKKAVVLYFSPAGVTAKVADAIHSVVGGEIVEIKGAKPYHNHPYGRALTEWLTAATPELGSKLPDLTGVDTVFIGYPVWFGTAPMIVKQVIKKSNLAGKQIVPFVYLNSLSKNNGKSIRLIRQHAPQATVLPRLMLDKPDKAAIEAYLKQVKLSD